MAQWKASATRVPRGRVSHEAFREQRLIDVTRVIAVADTRVEGPVRLTLLSLEVYRDGVVAQFLVVQEFEPAEGHRHGVPDLAATARDDVGTTYNDRPYGGSGAVAPAGIAQWRMAHAFSPAAPTPATEFRIRVEGVAWLEHIDEKLVETSRFRGPWEYAVKL